jgi:glycine dehydrogenase
MLSRLLPTVEAARTLPVRGTNAMRVGAVNGMRLSRCSAPLGSVPSARMFAAPAKASSGASEFKELLLPSDQFAQRHLGPSQDEVAEMCKLIGVKDLDDLMKQTIPDNVRSFRKLTELPDGKLGEAGALALLKSMVSKNVVAKNFIGMGYHGSHTPQTILRNVTENPGWYTAYTPYQAELSQGRCESLINFQTLVCELTGMEIANSSLLDEGTAAAEAMAMVARTVNAKKKNQFFVSENVHPQTIEVMRVRAEYFNLEFIVGDHHKTDFASMDALAGALVQYPDTHGTLNDFSGMAEQVHKTGAF